MKFSVNKERFLERLQLVQSVVSTRSTVPILSNVLLEASDGSLQLTATDLEVGVQASIDAEVETSGSTTLPAKRLLSIVKELPVGTLTIDVNESNVATIDSGTGTYKINGLAKDEFPPLPVFEESAQFTIPQKSLLEGFRRTYYASSTDETRYILNGVYCVFAEGKLTLVATDGRRLALMEVGLEIEPAEELKIIIPSKAVSELQRLLKDEGEVQVSVTQNRAAFELNGVLLVTQLVDGNYPNYRQVIPSETKHRVNLERETFLNVLRRVALLAQDKNSIVKLHFSEDNLELSADASEIGEARENLPIIYKGEELSIAFNPEFVMAPLRHLSDDEVFLELIDGMSPGVLKTAEPFQYVIMPLRIAR